MENMELKNKIITFCFPYRGAGGVPLLFLRLANNLNKLNYKVAIIDYIDGFMSLNNNENIDFIEYKDNKDIDIFNNNILIFQTMTPWSIYPSLKVKKDVNLFFISTLPTNFYPFLPFMRDKMALGGLYAKVVWNTVLRDEYKKVINFLKLGKENKSLVFLDEDIVSNVRNSLNSTISDPQLLPLFSENSESNFYLNKINFNKNNVTFGWVGRISDFKVHILNKVIFDLKEYSDSNDINISFIIIGEGEKESTLLNLNTDNFIIERINRINPIDLSSKLLTFDLYFAMGTSALDGARLGLPTVRLDYSYEKIYEAYKYKFLYDVKGHSLGELIGGKFYNKGLYTMNEVISKLLKDRNKLSTLTYDFYCKNHSLDSSTSKFINLLEKSKLKYNDLTFNNLLNSRLYDFWKKIRG